MRTILATTGVLVSMLLGTSCSGGDPTESIPTPAAEDPLGRCLPEITASDPARPTTFQPGPDASMPGVLWGEGGGTVLVLLHQTDRDGLCGWTPFARHAAEQGMTAIAFDMCGWASSDCAEEWDERSSDQVAHVVRQAREEWDARRVVLVGASLGAARTVFALADGVRPDAWVYLSGPPSWDGREVAAEARRIAVPGLVLHDPDDGDAEYAASRATARAAGAEFVRARGGHGYDILWDVDGSLTRLGRQVLDYARG